jgi:hypothetical protein
LKYLATGSHPLASQDYRKKIVSSLLYGNPDLLRKVAIELIRQHALQVKLIYSHAASSFIPSAKQEGHGKRGADDHDGNLLHPRAQPEEVGQCRALRSVPLSTVPGKS